MFPISPGFSSMKIHLEPAQVGGGLVKEKPFVGSSSEVSSNSPGDLVYEYLEAAMPFGREPLADKASCTSNEDGQSSSKSVAAPSKLPLPTFGLASYKFKRSVWSPDSDVDENQRAGALLGAAEEWLRRLKVVLPDFRHFVSHSGSGWR
ncbi:unnamed protein product [Microthlaspi erraticum]|uniref:Uncharacterized protein n=1 Tax=Microthlaspi erraticum TaxID=1685480 RepID=A0A6D2L8R5_9BRAS|nr:unnamed protein product [Microthlaspi erraticum]